MSEFKDKITGWMPEQAVRLGHRGGAGAGAELKLIFQGKLGLQTGGRDWLSVARPLKGTG